MRLAIHSTAAAIETGQETSVLKEEGQSQKPTMKLGVIVCALGMRRMRLWAVVAVVEQLVIVSDVLVCGLTILTNYLSQVLRHITF